MCVGVSVYGLGRGRMVGWVYIVAGAGVRRRGAGATLTRRLGLESELHVPVIVVDSVLRFHGIIINVSEPVSVFLK
jgi:hypothetical protein